MTSGVRPVPGDRGRSSLPPCGGGSGRGASRARPPFDLLPDGDGPALCRGFCSRLKAGGRPFPKGSPDGIALCRFCCRGFARGLPMIVVRRPRGSEGAR